MIFNKSSLVLLFFIRHEEGCAEVGCSLRSPTFTFGVLMLEIIRRSQDFAMEKEGKPRIAYAWQSWCETGGINLLIKDVVDMSTTRRWKMCADWSALRPTPTYRQTKHT